MSKTILIPVLFAVLFQSCAQNNDKKTAPIRQQPKVATSFQLTDFLSDNADLTAATDKVFASLDDTAIVAQLIMPAVGRLGQTEETIKSHIKSRIIGGVLLLNGTKTHIYRQLSSLSNNTGDVINNLNLLRKATNERS
jgi:hypothetical protein